MNGFVIILKKQKKNIVGQNQRTEWIYQGSQNLPRLEKKKKSHNYLKKKI